MTSLLQRISVKLKKNLTKEIIRSHISNDIVNYFYHFPKAVAALLWYQYPASEMTVVGVTGTDGKTTTTNIIFHILKTAGYRASLISTVKAVIGNQEYDTGLHVTNPDSFALQRLISEAKQKGSKYLVLEATSHGLVQYRNLGANINIGVITNISHEHLDYHKSMKNYILAKARILNRVKYSILNRDDKYFRMLKNHYSGRLLTFGINKKADYTPKTFPFKTKLYGKYNKYNCLAAIAVCKTLGVDNEVIRNALTSFKGVPGRMEEVGKGKKYRMFIDFAHKPNALENILESSRKLVKGNGRLIVMYGAAGLRDRTKRPIMGEISGRLADITVLTTEDPRTENANRIISQIEKGVLKSGAKEIKNIRQMKGYQNKSKYYLKIPDRKKAINRIINRLAGKNDIILFCGKGHEKSMCFGNKEYPWNEKEEILNALNK